MEADSGVPRTKYKTLNQKSHFISSYNGWQNGGFFYSCDEISLSNTFIILASQTLINHAEYLVFNTSSCVSIIYIFSNYNWF